MFRPENSQICPQCGTINADNLTTCTDCGYRMAFAAPRRRDRAHGVVPFASALPTLAKIVTFCAIVAGLVGLSYWAASAIHRNAMETNPYPKDPAVTTTEFFTALYNEDYQNCYKLLPAVRKVFTVLGKQSRPDAYFPHFQRIGDYLAENAGADFIEDMHVAANGERAEFANGVTITVTLEQVMGLDKKPHYALKEIDQFPIDIAPSVGFEKRNRSLERTLQSIEALSSSDPSDDPAEIIRQRPGESKRERLKRLIFAARFARQLDTRHTLLVRIVNEFPQQRQTRELLEEVAANEDESPHLRLWAQDILQRLQVR